MEDFFWNHNENLKAIERAIGVIKRQLNNSIRQNKEISGNNDDDGVDPVEGIKDHDIKGLTKVLSYLVTCWAEVRILKVIFSHNSFGGRHNKSLSESEKKELVERS